MAVVVPPSECDPVAVLVDGQTQRGAWYCSHAGAPQTYELMFADTAPRSVRAVGFVASNLGPDGVGAVRVRVQAGHGVMAEGETFRAVPRGHAEQLQIVVLPRAVEGDHIVLTFERRSRYATAICLGEIAAYGDDFPRDAYVVRARPYVAASSSSTPPPSSEAPSASTPPTSSSPSPSPANSGDASAPVDASAADQSSSSPLQEAR
jgi:hypothetical protein